MQFWKNYASHLYSTSETFSVEHVAHTTYLTSQWRHCDKSGVLSLDYFLICAGGSSDCAVALQSTSSQRQGEAASSDQHPRLAAQPKTMMKTGAWRIALCTWLEGISKLLRKPPASSHGNENCVHAMWPRVPSQVFVHVT